ncbi:glycosyltransferase family 9 protein [Desulfovibrio sulfodismutans]|uniref:Glycosyltransferase family 9 protein n=1 Tax=Desulfolutivibrio sulfodismutans TaxID=63561 RepID=A0A7K3NNT1_9BACT|nr:glycosyltransferase family 9 protein [Desulfolutivibrio sulfodismutans]NDY57846.1 glycosyltransferase family 9 protein [Desulfolutivibrio sulfodismutans]QLA10984.1 glycosyltransferase family 9 protein [Desulfolutivibrio sulfodismutans DSM 3696]
MNTLVINLTRFGDLLQCQPVFAELAASGGRTGLVCLENFAGAAGLLRDVGQIFPLAGASLLHAVDTDWKKALSRFREFIDGIKQEFSPTRVINLTPSVSARVLSRHLADGEATGFALDAEGFGRDSSPWAAFLEISAANRGLSPFNIVDLFRRAAGLGHVPAAFDLRAIPPDQRAWAGERLTQAAPEGTRGFVGFQLGASEEGRRWPVAYFARFGEAVWERAGIVPVLLGAGSERELARRYAAACRAPAVDLTGETSLDELAAVVSCVRVLVTNDTGTMHLAAGLGTPVMAFFLATAQPFDTGPYRAGSLSLEPDMACHPCPFGTKCPHDRACRRAISPETAQAALFSYLETGRFPVGGYATARAWESFADADGFMALRSLSGHETEDRTAWLSLLRRIFRQFLDDEPVRPSGPPIGFSPEAVRNIRSVLADSAGLLRLLQGQAEALAHAPHPNRKDKFLGVWRRVHGLWSGDPRFRAMGYLWMHLSQAPGVDLCGLKRIIDRYFGLVEAAGRLVGQGDLAGGTGIE